MSYKLEKSIVRIFSVNETILGCGFLIHKNWVVTCNHVINNIGNEKLVVQIDFPFVENKSIFESQTVFCCPEEDIAFLKLDSRTPENSQCANLVFSNEFRRHRAWTYGFPEKHDNGVSVEGKLVSRLTNGKIQFDGGNNNGYWIKKGFSGAPVWDDELKGVIGMVAATETNPKIKSAFLIPSDLLGKKWSEFRKKCQDVPEITVTCMDLSSVCPKLVNVPSLPESYVPRSEESEKLKSVLLRKEVREGVLVASAIHGAGGIGKTILATLIVNDPAIKNHFFDGIFWVTLGQNPDILSLLNVWIHSLGDNSFKPTTSEAASAYLRTLMQEKHVLLVVDDAWETNHVKYFKVGGPFCKLLITTRDALIAKELDISLYELDVMKGTQALELLSNNLNRRLQGEEREKALDLAKAVGYLPLALKLSAVQILEGFPWEELLDELKAEVANLKALDIGYSEDDELSSRNLSIRACFKLSLRRLPSEIYSCFPFFGILPEDVLINHEMMATIWKDSPFSTKKKLIYFKDKALLTTSNTYSTDGKNISYRIHDLLHDLARNLIQDPVVPDKGGISGLGLTLNEAHKVVLSRYFEKAKANLWHTIPDDNYIYDHLTWHIEKSRSLSTIHKLLSEETSDQKNGWYQARVSQGQVSGFIEDVSRVLRLEEFEYENVKTKGELVRIVGLQIRYSLMIASINSLSASIHAELMATLVDRAVWTELQGYAYSQHIPIPYQRAKAMLYIARKMSNEHGKEALDRAWMAAKQISDYKCKLIMLTKVATYFNESARDEMLRDVLGIIKSIENRGIKNKLIIEVLSIFPESGNKKIIEDIIELSNQISDEYIKLEILLKVSRIISKNQCLIKDEVLIEIINNLKQKDRSPQNDIFKKKIITELVIELNPSRNTDIFEEVLNISRYIWDNSLRAEVLSKIYSFFPESICSKIMLEAIESAREIFDDSKKKAETLSKISVNLPPLFYEQVFNEALCITHDILSERTRVKTLIEIFRYAPKPKRKEIFYEIIKLIPKVNLSSQRQLLEKLINSLSIYDDEKLVKELLQIEEESVRRLIVLKLCCNLKDFSDKQLIERIISSLNIQKDDDKKAFLSELFCELLKKENIALLKDVAASLPEETLIYEIEKAKNIVNAQERNCILFKLALCLPLSMVDSALGMANEISDNNCKEQLLKNIFFKLPKSRLLSELGSTRQINDEESQAIMLIKLAPHLQNPIIVEAISEAKNIREIEYRVKLLSEVVLNLPDSTKVDTIYQIISLSRNLHDKEYGLRNLVNLATKSKDPLKTLLLQESLKMADEITDLYKKEMLLVDVISNLPDSMVNEAFKIVGGFRYTNMKIQALIKITPKLSESFVKLVLDEVKSHIKSINKHQIKSIDLPEKDYLLKYLVSRLATNQIYANKRSYASKKDYQDKREDKIEKQTENEIKKEIEDEIKKEMKRIDNFWASIDNNLKLKLLIELAPKLPLSIQNDTLNVIIHEIDLSSDEVFKSKTLAYINTKFPNFISSESINKALNNVLEAVNCNSNYQHKVKVKAELAINLEGSLRNKVLSDIIDTSRQITDVEQRVKTIIEIISSFPELIDNNLLKELLKEAYQIKDKELKIKTLAILSTYLPSPFKEKTVENAIELANEIVDHRYRAKILVEISSSFYELTDDFIYKFWKKTIHLLSSNTRESLMLNLSALIPLIYRLGGATAVEDTFTSVKDVSRWWS